MSYSNKATPSNVIDPNVRINTSRWNAIRVPAAIVIIVAILLLAAGTALEQVENKVPVNRHEKENYWTRLMGTVGLLCVGTGCILIIACAILIPRKLLW